MNRVYDARSALSLDRKIYKSVNGDEYDVTYTPAIITQLSILNAKLQSQVMKIFNSYDKVMAELKLGMNVEENTELINGWETVVKQQDEISWKIISETLKANNHDISVDQLRVLLMREEVPHFVQFINTSEKKN
jgi:hypothetical protein